MISLKKEEWFSNIRTDVLAGLVVGLALIPESIAFSAIAGILVNVIFVIINLIPAKSFGSDGYNVINIGKTNNSKKAYWLELNMTGDILQGKKFSDMPQHYFEFEVEDLHLDNVCASLYMQYCYFVCTWQTEKAKDLITALYNNLGKMPLSNANTI